LGEQRLIDNLKKRVYSADIPFDSLFKSLCDANSSDLLLKELKAARESGTAAKY